MHWGYICEIVTFQITLYILLIKVFSGKITKSFTFCPLLTLSMLFILECNHYQDILFFICNIILYFVFPIILIKNIKKSIIFYISIIIAGLFSLLNVSTSFITTFINTNLANTNISNITVDVIITLMIIYLSMNQKLSNHIAGFISTSTKIKIIFAVFIWELVILVSLLTVLLGKFSETPIVSLSCFLMMIVLVISCVVFYFLIVNDLKNAYYKKINLSFQKHINEQVKHYEHLSHANKNLSKFRHDYNNLKIGLKSFLNSRDYNGALKYLNDCDKMIEPDNSIYNTGHPIVDALLFEKMNTDKRKNIDIVFNGIIPSNVLTPADLCIIFGNILDNALESCAKTSNIKSTISITVKQSHDYIFIVVKNPTIDNVSIKNNTILSTKNDSNQHGIGLYSIKHVLKKYNGHLYLNCKDNIFTTEIDFCVS